MQTQVVYVALTVCIDTNTGAVVSSTLDGVYPTMDEAQAAFPPGSTQTGSVLCTTSIIPHSIDIPPLDAASSSRQIG
jgi:hypothetical protein